MVTDLKKYVYGCAAASPKLTGVVRAVLSLMVLIMPAAMAAQVSHPITSIQPAPVVRTNDSYAPVFTAANPAWVQTIAPESYPDNELVVSGIIPLADSRQIGSLRAKDFYREVANELRRQLSLHIEVPGTEFKRLSLAGYGVPVGNYRDNELSSTQRAVGLKNHLLNLSGQTPSSLDVSWVAEDWESILTALQHSDFRLKDAAIDIIRNVEVSAGRESQLMMLAGGELYARLQQSVFPQISRIEFTAVLGRGQSVSPDVRQGMVSLTDMYRTAQAMTKGDPDYCDLLDLSVRLYPTSSVACINGAAVALMRGDLDRAGQLLAGLETDSRAYCNFGVYYMLKGEPEKAEIYLLMAASGNVGEAKAALEALNIEHL